MHFSSYSSFCIENKCIKYFDTYKHIFLPSALQQLPPCYAEINCIKFFLPARNFFLARCQRHQVPLLLRTVKCIKYLHTCVHVFLPSAFQHPTHCFAEIKCIKYVHTCLHIFFAKCTLGLFSHAATKSNESNIVCIFSCQVHFSSYSSCCAEIQCIKFFSYPCATFFCQLHFSTFLPAGPKSSASKILHQVHFCT